VNRTFVVPDEKMDIYEKFKASVPEVSRELVEFMEDYVNKLEAVDGQMKEQTIYEGMEYGEEQIYEGETFKFYGVKLSEGTHFPDTNKRKKVYLTKKGKFLVQSILLESESDTSYSYKVYEDYFEMKSEAGLPKSLISPVEAYLNKNSVIRTFKVLDV
jgi:hypothetical protein